MIRVILAEDQGLVRGALGSLLQMEEDIDVVAQAADGEEAWQAICDHLPDVAVLDIEMPRRSGLEVVELINTHRLVTRALIVTTFARSGYLDRAVKSGAWGYLLKDARIEDLTESIRQVHRGHKVMAPELLMEVIARPNPLSPRERDVLKQAASGLGTKEISNALFLSEGTVRNYLSDSIAKLACSTRQEAIRVAQEHGWL